MAFLNLDNLKINKIDTQLLFDTIKYSIFKKNNTICYFSKILNKEVNSSKLPLNFNNVDFIEFDTCIILLIGKKELHIFNTIENTLKIHLIDPAVFGEIQTKIYLYDDNRIVFGCKFKDSFHFIKFNLDSGVRESQTYSFKINKISSSLFYDKKVYCIIDDAFILCFNMEDGSSDFKRFEVGKINSQLFIYNNKLLYSYNNIINIYNNKNDIKSIKTDIQFNEQLALKNNILVCSDGFNLYGFNLIDKEQKWQLKGNLEIIQTIDCDLFYKNKNRDGLIVLTRNHLSFIDYNGKILFNMIYNDIAKIIKTSSSIVLKNNRNENFIIELQ